MITSAESSKIMADKCFKIEYRELVENIINSIKSSYEQGFTDTYLDVALIKKYDFKVLTRTSQILMEEGYKVSFSTGKFARDKKPSFYIDWSSVKCEEDFKNEC